MKRAICMLLTVPLALLAAPCSVSAQEVDALEAVEDAAAGLAGDTITLDAEELDIRALLKLVAQVRRLNIVAGPEVSGTVSVNLFEVPFDDALDAILGVGGYTHYKKGGIVYVTTEAGRGELPLNTRDMAVRVYEIRHSTAEELSETIQEFLSPGGKGVIKSGSLIVQDTPEYLERLDKLIAALDVPPERSTVFEVSHADPQEVLDAINNLLSPRGLASLTATNRIVIRDAPEYVESIASLVKSLDTPPRQVLISAKILNINYDDEFSLGTEFVSSSVVDPRAASLDPSLDLVNNFRRDLTALTTGQAGIFSLIIRDHEYGFISALSERSRIDTLSAPQLLTMDGETAKIQVGQRLGFRVTTTTQTSSLESVEFLEVGTVLEVTPTIASDGLVKMELNPKVSTGSITNDGLPEERTTEATTTLLVRSGETILIGGLINASKQQARSGVPVLSKIPMLGLLFGRKSNRDSKSELIILVTPHLVQSVPSENMASQIEKVRVTQEELLSDSGDFDRILQKPISPPEVE